MEKKELEKIRDSIFENCWCNLPGNDQDEISFDLSELGEYDSVFDVPRGKEIRIKV